MIDGIELKMVSRVKIKWRFCIVLIQCLLLLACAQEDSSRTIKSLNVGVLPDQNEVMLRNRYQPLLDEISLHTGLDSKLLIPDSYGQLLEWFNDNKVDLALFGGATYVKARLKNKAIPLVMRDVDGNFRSVALVRKNYVAQSLESLKGATLAFGAELSTSGHLMPRHFLSQKNIIPEVYFSKVEYTGAHDITAERVRDGKVDVGIVNSEVVHAMFLDGRLKKDNVRVIWESPAFHDYVWAVQADISKQQRTLIRDVFLHLNQDGEDELLLQGLGAKYYIPAGNTDFHDLEHVMLDMGKVESVK